jgi:peptidoglycan/LPS O-acetylase OafA/YrhL
LDALRGIAAVAVALHHLGRLYGQNDPAITPSLAVDLFFLLSGFVMSRTYESRLAANDLTPASFLAARYRRLFVPMAVGSSLGLVSAVMFYGPSINLLLTFILILGFMPTVWMSNCFLLNGPAWSLFGEIGANALHAMVFAKLSLKSIVLLWIASLAIWWSLGFSGSANWAPNIGAILSLLPRVFSCYLMGIIIFRRYGDKPFGNQPLAAIVAFWAFGFATHLGVIGDVVATVIVAPFIVRAALALPERRWAAAIGALSFPLYAVHAPLFELAFSCGASPVVAFFAAVALAAIIAVLFESRRGRTASKVLPNRSGHEATRPAFLDRLSKLGY